MVNLGDNNGGGIRIVDRISWGNLASIISLGAGLAWSWQSLTTGQARVEEQLNEIHYQIQLFQHDHDSLTKLESRLDALEKRGQ